MKDAMWKVDPSYGVPYRGPRDTQQQMLRVLHTMGWWSRWKTFGVCSRPCARRW